MLTDKDMKKMSDLNSKNNYVITNGMLKMLISKHNKARKENNQYRMELIEYRLTDINFHYECGLLRKGDYKEAFNRL